MLRFLTAGESHGPQLTTILEGFPAGVPLDLDRLNQQLARRQKGYGSGGRMKIESDAVHISAGFMNGLTTGGPIAITVVNRDFAKWQHRDIDPMTIPRPGHADLTGAIKYGYTDLRLALERASARETAVRVAIGALCQQLLAHFDITIGSYVTSIGDVTANIPATMSYPDRFAAAETNDIRTPMPDDIEAMRQKIWEIMQAKDTIGGIFEVVALGLPPGLGSHVHWDRRLNSQLLWYMSSIQAIKGVEIGHAFANSSRPGTEVHDEIFLDDDGQTLTRHTNNSGGFEGGITTGEPVIVRAAMKPISTVLNPRKSVDLVSGEEQSTVYERSDFCAVPRAAVVGEAMIAIPLANALLEKLGGDSLAEMKPRFQTLRQARLDDLLMDNLPWRFGY
ncbi:MAG TPA: chorismate synthase [Anaerolineae bacterium]|nr:chorismate synthase [Anaerolineae bacterium]